MSFLRKPQWLIRKARPILPSQRPSPTGTALGPELNKATRRNRREERVQQCLLVVCTYYCPHLVLLVVDKYCSNLVVDQSAVVLPRTQLAGGSGVKERSSMVASQGNGMPANLPLRMSSMRREA